MTSPKSSSSHSYSGTLHSLDNNISTTSIDQTFTWKLSDPFIQIHDSKSAKIYVDDILAIRESEDSNLESFEILYYPLENRKRIRKRSLIISDDLPNLRSDLEAKLKPPIPPHKPQKLTSRKVLVLINPFSGQKKALNLYNTFCKSIFFEANIQVELRFTKHANHATEIIQTLDIDCYESVAVVSGDGLVNEVITGLLTRSDRDRALRFPIIHIPGGTGNSLAASIAFKCGEPFSARGGFCRELTLMAVNPSYKQLRLHHFESASDGHKCVFLSVVWGLIADIDIGSERFRWAGMIRLHMEALLRTMQLPSVAKYKGRISYLPIDDEALIKKTRFKNNEPRKSFGKGHFEGGDIQDMPEMDLRPSKPKINTVKDSFSSRELVKIPRLDEPVPDDWITLDSEFVMVQVTSLSHIGSDLPYTPSSKLEEEVLYLSLVDWSVVKHRFSIARMFADMDICAHLDYPCFHFIPVKACRIEPAPGAGGHVAVDGEPCTSGSTFQVVASSLCATVTCRELRD